MSITPANGSTAVGVNSKVVVTFNEAINPLTVNSSSIIVRANGITVAGNYAVNGSVITFTPLNALPAVASVQVVVVFDSTAAVQDLVGNRAQAGGGGTSTFTTASTPDTTVPTVVMVTPSNGSTGVGLNGQVVVVFSKSMNPTTLSGGSFAGNIALLAGGLPQSFSTSISADNRTVVLSGLKLPASTVITLAIPPTATDLSGNALAAFTSEFMTAAAFDTTHGSVANQRPGNGATGVSINASPVVLFVSKPLSASTAAGAMHVSQAGQAVAGTVAVVGNGQTIEFTPSSPWTYGALIEVFLDATATDTSGNTMTAYRGTFTTVGNPASTAPALVNVSPMSGATAVPLNVVVDAGFSEALDPTTVVAKNVYLRSSSGTIASTPTLNTTGTVIRLTPGAVLTANTQYCFYLYNLQGVNGVAAANQYYCFTTGTASQTTAPTVVTVSPENGLGSVALNANVGVVFSAPIDPVTVSGTTIQLSGGGMTSVPSSISFTNNNQTVEITPEAPLPASTAMTLTISGVKDVAGNAVAAQTTHFTTGTAAATSTPGFVVTNPISGATGVPVNAAISLQANAEIDGTTVNSSTFRVSDNTLNIYLSGTYSLSADGMTVYFVPATQLATGRTYTVNASYSSSMTDVAGNTIAGSYYTFTTGFAASTTSPQVTGVSPSTGLTKVPINAQIVVSFSEPVNGESLAGVTLSANGSTVGLSDVLSSGNQLLTITPLAGLLPNTTYTLTVNAVADLSGNAMTTPFTSTFTTSAQADLSSPSVLATMPTNGATGVLTTSAITVRFSKYMNPLSINALTFNCTSSGGTTLSGTISVSQDGSTATFTPGAAMAKSTVYTVQLTNGIIDLEDQSLARLTSSFTTAAQ